MIKLNLFKHNRFSIIITVLLSLAWSTSAFSFYTVHKVKKLSLGVTFQSGLSDISRETVSRIDIVQELLGGRREAGQIAAAVVDCNYPGSIWLVIWDLNNQNIVPDSSVIRLTALYNVTNRNQRKDRLTSLLDTDALFGSGYITARMNISRINDRLIPEGASPDDKTDCVSRLEGLSVAGVLEGDSNGIVTSGQFKFGKPFATLLDF
jgi:hypothetical protein